MLGARIKPTGAGVMMKNWPDYSPITSPTLAQRPLFASIPPQMGDAPSGSIGGSFHQTLEQALTLKMEPNLWSVNEVALDQKTVQALAHWVRMAVQEVENALLTEASDLGVTQRGGMGSGVGGLLGQGSPGMGMGLPMLNVASRLQSQMFRPPMTPLMPGLGGIQSLSNRFRNERRIAPLRNVGQETTTSVPSSTSVSVRPMVAPGAVKPVGPPPIPTPSPMSSESVVATREITTIPRPSPVPLAATLMAETQSASPRASGGYPIPGASPKAVEQEAYPYAGLIRHAANEYDLDEALLRSVVEAESNYNPQAVSRVGAQGLMQLMPATAASLGVTDSFDPEQNIMGGAKYLKRLLDRYRGNQELALAAYNWGPGNLERRPHAMPRETKNYITKISQLMRTHGSELV